MFMVPSEMNSNEILPSLHCFQHLRNVVQSNKFDDLFLEFSVVTFQYQNSIYVFPLEINILVFVRLRH